MTHLPLTIIGGFLGAGKTTLIQRLLTHTEGRRIAVLVNDFGKLNIDAKLIAQAGADTIELTNGCVCCSIGDDLNGALIQLESRASDFDHVVIEASGVSDPWKIAQIGLLNAGYRLDGVIVLVDAASVQDLLNNPRYEDTVIRQCRRADLLLVNKIDLVSDDATVVEAKVQDITRQLLGQASATRVIACSQGTVPPELLLGSWRKGRAAEDEHTQSVNTAWGDSIQASKYADKPLKWQSLSFTSTSVWTKGSFETCLPALPDGLIRGKAILLTETATWFEWHRVCGRDTWLEHHASPPTDQSVLVLIGLEAPTALDVEALVQRGWR